MFLSYTIFSNASCTEVREVVNAYGSKANMLLKAFRNVGKCEPKEGQIIAGCRIDRIDSEEYSED